MITYDYACDEHQESEDASVLRLCADEYVCAVLCHPKKNRADVDDVHQVLSQK
ncbi:hypothetical protein [Legionella anisa]|nr:hypothetical protein [Legionella anisa]